MKKIFTRGYILCVILAVSCSRISTAPMPRTQPSETPLSPLESAMQKIKQHSPGIEKYYLFDKTGELIVKADLAEIRQETGTPEYFQVRYDLKQLSIDGGAYVIPFTVKCMETGTFYEDDLLWRPREDASGILISFDDNYKEIWSGYFDVFDRYNARVTFFVPGTYCSFTDAALQRGHDIGYHTLGHSVLPRVSRQVFLRETLSHVEIFRNAGARLLSFAYPFGLYESWMHEELLKTYRVLRGFNISFQAYDAAAIRDGLIHSRSVDNVFFDTDDEFTAAIDIMFRTLKFTEQDLVLPLSSHVISDTAEWGIKPHRLEYILQAARDLRLNFYRYSDFF